MANANGVSRRTASNVTRTMGSGFVSSGTFVYSGIIAAAAAYDARIKNQRRDKWDSAIAEMRQELECDQKRIDERRQVLSAEMDAMDLKIEEDGIEEENGHSLEECSPVSYDVQEETAEGYRYSTDLAETNNEPYDPFEDIQPRSEPARWPANTYGPVNTRNVAPESLYATTDSKQRAAKRRWTRKKIENMNIQISLLQVRLVLLLHERGWLKEAVAAVPHAYGAYLKQPTSVFVGACEEITSKGKSLSLYDHQLSGYNREADSSILCDYHQDAFGHFHDINFDLNESLQQLFSLHFRQQLAMPALIAKITQNLTISTAPPNVETFNILLAGFSRVREHEANSYVIRAIRYSKIRPNEVTLNRILSHYVDTSDPKGWGIWIGRLRGKYGGVMLARPDVSVNEASEGRLVKVESPSGTKVIQNPYPTPMVLTAVINGALKFLGFETCMEVYKEFREQGYGLSSEGLLSLLNACVSRRDWDTSASILGQIERLESEDYMSLPLKDAPVPRISLNVFAGMLQACRDSSERGLFTRILRYAQLHGHDRQQILDAVRQQKMEVAKDDAAAGNDIEPLHAGKESREVGQASSSPAPLFNSKQTGGEQVFSHLESATHNLASNRTLEKRRSNILGDDTERPRGIDGEQSDASVIRYMHHRTMTREELDGLLPASEHLEGYEMVERPMAIDNG
ncbi:hypothetical protein K431DRAFT_282564 [Polychaeton citri CBS 116435]|uniref:Pentatricopeptide repeat protein n=1 Tax=Polychaeton citri CBS 116435 TaxID=1314669 RepID=A0A9P4QB08_9PEZI|nr:hypothetical protein K431DRAFT_282564 [Polychaeton citri CBS 116435]